MNFEQYIDDLDKRVYNMEQLVTSPSVMGGDPNGAGSGEGDFDQIIVRDPDTGEYIVIAMVPPNAPQNLSVTTGTFFNSSFADVSWDDPVVGETDTDLAGEAVWFEVDLARKNPDDTYDFADIITTLGNNARFEGLSPGQEYGVRVVARNRIGIFGVYTPWVDFIAEADQTIPSAVTGLGLFRGATSAVVKFDPIADEDVILNRGFYEVQIDTANTFNSPNFQQNRTSATIVAFNDLEDEATWYARVRAVDSSGNPGAWATTTGDVAGGVVDDMVIAGLNAAKITFGTMSGDRIAANSLDVGRIKSGTLTSTTITIGSGGQFKIGNPPNSGIFINDQGIRGYQNGSLTFSLDVTGAATFGGTLSSGVSLQSPNIFGGSISGGLITGARIVGNEVESSSYNASPRDGWKLWDTGHADFYGGMTITSTISIRDGGGIIFYNNSGTVSARIYQTGNYWNLMNNTLYAGAIYSNGNLVYHTGNANFASSSHTHSGYALASHSHSHSHSSLNTVTIWGRLYAPGMLQSSAGAHDVRYYTGSSREVVQTASSRDIKSNVRIDHSINNEYLSKLLNVDIPVWDAMTRRPGQPPRPIISRPGTAAATDRGSIQDRIGPVVEDAAAAWTEAVLYDEDGNPQNIDTTLVLHTIWHGVKEIVQALKQNDILDAEWPLSTPNPPVPNPSA